MGIALNIVYLVICVVLIFVVLMQSGKQAGLSGSIAGGAETFFGKTKARTWDAKFSRLTSVFAVLFVILAVALHFVL